MAYSLKCIVVPPEAMRDRARALLKLVEADRNRLYGNHRIFLRQLCKIFPDLEEQARETATAAARALLGKKGRMIHQVYQPQEPSVKQEVDEGKLLEVGEDFRACLKGIAKRLIVNQSNPSNGNVAQLISLAKTPQLLETTKSVLVSQRWHLRAGHEPLSTLFINQAIKVWPASEVAKLGDFLESSISQDSNFACIMTPPVLISAIEHIDKRTTYGEKEAAIIWSWLNVALRLFNSGQAYCGEAMEEPDRLIASYLSLFAHSGRLVPIDSEFKVPKIEQSLPEFIFSVVEKTLTPATWSHASVECKSDALRLFVQAKKPLPGFIQPADEPSYVKLFAAYSDGQVDLEHLEAVQVESDPQGHSLNLKRFLSSHAAKVLTE